jgi:hypothetical protein
VPRKRKVKEPTREEIEAVGANDLAPPRPIPEAPDSILSKTSSVEDEQRELRAVNYSTVNLEELEERIGLTARIVLEHALRYDNRMVSPKDKCDIALRAITVLEGSRQEVTWRDARLKAPTRTSTAAIKAEKKRIGDQLMKAALRKKEIQVAQAEKALEAMEHESDVDPTKVN